MTHDPARCAPALRVERDFIGEVSIPRDKFYGVNTARGLDNLKISPLSIAQYAEFRDSFARIKWAAALANRDCGILTPRQCDAIMAACREIIEGKLDASLLTDLLEGSGGTSTNMNFNEVIAHRAQQMLGSDAGTELEVHPNDHVNRSQSTNDVYPSALKMAAYEMLEPLIGAISRLADVFRDKAEEFADILHLGRTCLQDAQPMRLGQLFAGYAALAARSARELSAARDKLRVLPLGGTAIGTGFGAPAGYRSAVYQHLQAISGVAYQTPSDSFDAMQNMDVFSRVSAELRTCAAALAKIASDLILLSSGPVGGVAELHLPAVQAGSSIMPGKVNPVVPMMMIQLSFAISGNDTTVAQAVQYGALEINHFEPVVASRLFDSIELLTHGICRFGEKCVAGIVADVARNERHLLDSMAVATALVPSMGYARVSQLARQSVAEGRPLVNILEDAGLLSVEAMKALVRDASRPVFGREPDAAVG
jgi:aspartate ammonia-lyase